jgi:hypothetical protein
MVKSRDHSRAPNFRKHQIPHDCSALTGDAVETENYYQHAEHYFRMTKDRTE